MQEQVTVLNKQKITVIITCLLCMLLLFSHVPKQAEVTVLDVGQGDGIYIHTSDGADVFIDGGSNDVKQVGTYRILPFLKAQGVAGIDYWFVSHLDQDHISGLIEAIESGYRIGQVVLAQGVVRDEAYEELTEALANRQIAIQYLDKGAVLRGRTASFTCLAPGLDAVAGERNADSLVLLYEECGFTGFFSGDIPTEEEEKLAAEGKLPAVSFYKAAHHGSKYSNSEKLLSRLQPRVSVVSCSEKNKYGHPGEEAVTHMEESSGLVCYTMKAGQVRVCWGKRGVEVYEYF